MVRWERRLRSVDSERASRVIELRKASAEADTFQTVGGCIDPSGLARMDRLGGVEEQGTYAMGFPGTREVLSSPRETRALGAARERPGPRESVGARGSEQTA